MSLSVEEVDALVDGMSDDELKEWHQEKCDEADCAAAWEHAFAILGYVNEEDGSEWGSIERPRRRVVELFQKENWKQMGEVIGDWGDFKQIDMPGCNLGLDAEALFGSMQLYDFPLEVLNMEKNRLGARGISSMILFLKASTTLKWLNLGENNLGVEGARLFSEALNHVSIQVLSLHKNGIGDEGIGCLLATRNSKDLVELYLHDNVIRRSGIESISRFLGRDDIALKKLTLRCDDGSHVTMLLDAVSNDANLEELCICKAHGGQWVTNSSTLQTLQNKICNLSSFETLCQSNHQLRSLGVDCSSFLCKYYMCYLDLRSALDINSRSEKGASIAHRIRAKLRKFYFQDFDSEKTSCYDIQPFVDMDVVLMPHILQLVTRSEGLVDYLQYRDLCSGDLGATYRLIRNCHLPELFSFPPPESKVPRLEAKVGALEQHNAQLEARIAALEAENAKRKRENEVLVTEVKELRAANSSLPSKRKK